MDRAIWEKYRQMNQSQVGNLVGLNKLGQRACFCLFTLIQYQSALTNHICHDYNKAVICLSIEYLLSIVYCFGNHLGFTFQTSRRSLTLKLFLESLGMIPLHSIIKVDLLSVGGEDSALMNIVMGSPSGEITRYVLLLPCIHFAQALCPHCSEI